MLRASLHHNDTDLTPRPIVEGCGDCQVEHADEIMALVDAAVLRDGDEYPDARVRAELVLGRDGADRIAMIAGNFEMMNRLLDAIGTPVGRPLHPLAEQMGLSVPAYLHPDRS